LLSGQVLAVFVSQAAAGKQEKGVATNFAVWTRDTKVIIYEILKGYFFLLFKPFIISNAVGHGKMTLKNLQASTKKKPMQIF
jgi:hypothetical protein